MNIVKATITIIMVALIYAVLMVLLIQIPFHNKINMAISLIDKVSIDTSKKVLDDVKLDLSSKKLTSYPEYGTRYGTIIIKSINVNLPLYFGDTLAILKKGVGHSAGSYFPGEGGSILMMGHNYRGYLRDLRNVKINDIITLETTYGTFNYKVYQTKIIDEKNLDAVPIQDKEEILMLYTCSPVDAIGHPTKRLVLYAKPV